VSLADVSPMFRAMARTWLPAGIPASVAGQAPIRVPRLVTAVGGPLAANVAVVKAAVEPLVGT
jgi:hypothetical protein